MNKCKSKLPKLIKYKKYFDEEGFLIPFEENKKSKNHIPIKFKRIFFSHGKKNYFRGNHAHKKCSQFLICINGKIRIETENKKKRQFILSHKKNYALFMPPLTWNKLYFLKKNSLLAVICDYKYDYRKEYINDYKKFKSLISK